MSRRSCTMIWRGIKIKDALWIGLGPFLRREVLYLERGQAETMLIELLDPFLSSCTDQFVKAGEQGRKTFQDLKHKCAEYACVSPGDPLTQWHRRSKSTKLTTSPGALHRNYAEIPARRNSCLNLCNMWLCPTRCPWK